MMGDVIYFLETQAFPPPLSLDRAPGSVWQRHCCPDSRTIPAGMKWGGEGTPAAEMHWKKESARKNVGFQMDGS